MEPGNDLSVINNGVFLAVELQHYYLHNIFVVLFVTCVILVLL